MAAMVPGIVARSCTRLMPLHLVSSGSRRAEVRSVPIFWNMLTSSETEWAAEVQALVPPTLSEKNFDSSDAIRRMVSHADMRGESLPQLEDDDVSAP